MKKCGIVLGILLALAAVPGAALAGEEKDAAKRQTIDASAKETLDALFAKSPNAKDLFGKAYGYAVFENLKIALGVSGGGGSGVAVDKTTGARTYMKMGTGGIGLGLGGQKYELVLLFQTKKIFDSFITGKWQAGASAAAAAGTAGANAATGFVNGVATYQLTDKGLMANADISGTKYWTDDKLNAK